MKTLYTARDIEALAANGSRTLTLASDDILTPLARDRARELGLIWRRRQTMRPAPASRPSGSAPPAAAASGLASEALTAFLGLLQQARADVADLPQLASAFDDLLQAAEQGLPLHPSAQRQSPRLSPERQQRLLTRMAQLETLADFLFGPNAPARRYDILWTLTLLRSAIQQQP